ncbi:uncharacterized protein LOC119373344 [Rhipicephalus sanguineus]|uniref:uncharacterized protein LOC119373344 n=1 Tax=Rhipicephalus sanguineus TaxID=34632 RepID=UPI0020C59331|nr:uncharacterized protein LOC119373344 [Rhipicephalus sanguineus]
MSTNMEAALSSNEVVKAASKRLPVPFRRKELFLGSTLTHHTGILLVMSTTSAEVVEKAHRHFGEVEHRDLTAESESAIGRVASYTKVTHLSLVSSLPKDKCSFEPHVTEVLSVLRLVHLSLKRFCGVKLSVIANLCPHLKFLGIFMCVVDGEEDAAADFPNLEHLHLDCAMKEGSFFKLLRSCPGLRELELEVDELTTAFVVGPPESCGERPRLEHVKRLALRTNCDVESGLDTRDDLPSDLDLTLACLPSLRRVRSDSYEIRLHVASCFPHIALDWCVCTLCFAEFPKISGDHKDLYKITQDLQLMRPIEVVSYSFGEKSEKDKEGGEVPVDTKEEGKERKRGRNVDKGRRYGSLTSVFKNRTGI